MGTILFTQERVGKNERRFHIYKFRTMYVDAEKRIDPLRKQKNNREDPILKFPQDPRVTSVGRILRRFSLDEFPQLIQGENPFNSDLLILRIITSIASFPERIRFNPQNFTNLSGRVIFLFRQTKVI